VRDKAATTKTPSRYQTSSELNVGIAAVTVNAMAAFRLASNGSRPARAAKPTTSMIATKSGHSTAVWPRDANPSTPPTAIQPASRTNRRNLAGSGPSLSAKPNSIPTITAASAACDSRRKMPTRSGAPILTRNRTPRRTWALSTRSRPPAVPARIRLAVASGSMSMSPGYPSRHRRRCTLMMRRPQGSTS
jgi:hypothetical protein